MSLRVLPPGMRRANDCAGSDACSVTSEMTHMVNGSPGWVIRRYYAVKAEGPNFEKYDPGQNDARIYAPTPFWRYERELDDGSWLLLAFSRVIDAGVSFTLHEEHSLLQSSHIRRR